MADVNAMRAQLLRLRREVERERAVLQPLAAEIAKNAQLLTTPASHRALRAVVAVDLHRWYTALESILERIDKLFGLRPSGAEWHAELLAGAFLDVPSVRPPVLDAALADALREVLRFRHFFRHAYAVELDDLRLRANADRLAECEAQVSDCLVAFETILQQMADQLGPADPSSPR